MAVLVSWMCVAVFADGTSLSSPVEADAQEASALLQHVEGLKTSGMVLVDGSGSLSMEEMDEHVQMEETDDSDDDGNDSVDDDGDSVHELLEKTDEVVAGKSVTGLAQDLRARASALIKMAAKMEEEERQQIMVEKRAAEVRHRRMEFNASYNPNGKSGHDKCDYDGPHYGWSCAARSSCGCCTDDRCFWCGITGTCHAHGSWMYDEKCTSSNCKSKQGDSSCVHRTCDWNDDHWGQAGNVVTVKVCIRSRFENHGGSKGTYKQTVTQGTDWSKVTKKSSQHTVTAQASAAWGPAEGSLGYESQNLAEETVSQSSTRSETKTYDIDLSKPFYMYQAEVTINTDQKQEIKKNGRTMITSKPMNTKCKIVKTR